MINFNFVLNLLILCVFFVTSSNAACNKDGLQKVNECFKQEYFENAKLPISAIGFSNKVKEILNGNFKKLCATTDVFKTCMGEDALKNCITADDFAKANNIAKDDHDGAQTFVQSYKDIDKACQKSVTTETIPLPISTLPPTKTPFPTQAPATVLPEALPSSFSLQIQPSMIILSFLMPLFYFLL